MFTKNTGKVGNLHVGGGWMRLVGGLQEVHLEVYCTLWVGSGSESGGDEVIHSGVQGAKVRKWSGYRGLGEVMCTG